MSAAASPDLPPAAAAARRRRTGFWAAIFSGNLLVISIVLHVIFGVGATYFIVQRVQAKRKVTFQGGPPVVAASQRALEHKVSMAQKKKSGGAPPQAKRIVSTGLARVSLPEMPSLPTAVTVAPTMMAGMGGAGFGQGMGFGNGMGSGSGGGNGGGGMTMFGFHSANAGGLAGEFYDLKQTKARQPTNVDNKKYGEVVGDFVKHGWPEATLQEYYKAPHPLYAAQFMVPDIDAKLAPQAFQVEKEVKPERWVALYKGRVLAPESGTFHFVGNGDDILFVRFNGRTVFNGSWAGSGELGGDDEDKKLGVRTVARYKFDWPARGGQPLAKGESFEAVAGQSYPIEILIGEWPGGRSHFVLLIEKSGQTYNRGPNGVPVLPAFRVAEVKAPKLENGQTLPAHQEGGPIWKAQAAGTGSLLDALNK
jgi:hypothetical protein